MYVYCTTRFEAFHAWPDAATYDDEVAFLADRHRHEFCVRLDVAVTHDDRDIEFILLKRELEAFIDAELVDPTTRDIDRSCEQIATEIATHFHNRFDAPVRVDVSEDGENGAIVTHD